MSGPHSTHLPTLQYAASAYTLLTLDRQTDTRRSTSSTLHSSHLDVDVDVHQLHVYNMWGRSLVQSFIPELATPPQLDHLHKNYQDISGFLRVGRKKDPPPLRNSQELKLQYSDIEYESVEVDQSAKELSREYSALVDHLDAAAVTTWEERLQETIRFVFSHEQEGLLAIGTFALDQLVDHKFPPSSPATVTDQSTSDSSSTNTTVIHEVRSSDDEAESTDHSTTRKGSLVSDYPVFGDPGSIKALSLDDDHKLPEIRTSCSHSPTKQFVDSDDQTGALCGLFPVFRSRRRKPPEKKKKKKKKVVAENTMSTKAGTSLGAHLGRLWRSGCSTGGATHVSARVAPEKDPKTDSPIPTQGPPCIANCVEELSVASEVGEHRKRRSGSSFGNLGWPPCAHNGNWIRTDSEFVVLEM